MLHGVRAGDAIYDYVPGCDYVLVPTLMRVACRGIRPGTRKLALPKNALPFGLLMSMTLEGPWFAASDAASDAASAASVSVRIQKATGVVDVTMKRPKKSKKADTWCLEVDLLTPLAIAQDAADRDFKTVKAATGHGMTWRAIAAGAVGDITLTFEDDCGLVPDAFDIVFRGVNGVRLAPASSAAVSAVPIPVFLLPPLPPAVRLEQLQDRERERLEEAQAAAAK
jgi:hypothetical protein